LKKTVEGVEYEVSPVPPSHAPFQSLIDSLLKKESKDVEEAGKDSEELEKCIDKVLVVTVNPMPPKKHQLVLYNVVNAETRRVMREAGLFRSQPKRDPEKSGASESASGKKAE
jgi:hypothetical protein